METIWDWDLRLYPAALIAAVGLWLTVRGAAGQVRGLRTPLVQPGKNLRTVRAMRAFLQGLSLVAIGAGWWLQWPAMVAAGAIVGFEETIETSIAAWALRQEYEGENPRLVARP